jgi:hypothetical protein
MDDKRMYSLVKEIAQAMQDATSVYIANKESGSTALSLAYDSGRIDGLKQALEIIDRYL